MGKTIQDVLDHQNRLIPAGTWQDAVELAMIMGLVGSVPIAFNNWRLAWPILAMVGMHLLQLFMFMLFRRRAISEWVFMTLLVDIIVICAEGALLIGFVDTVLGTEVKLDLSDTKLNNIIKAAALGSMVLMDIMRWRQMSVMGDEEEREAEIMAATREYLESNARAYAPRTVAARQTPAYYAITTKAV